jgi:hypothetical protein
MCQQLSVVDFLKTFLIMYGIFGYVVYIVQRYVTDLSGKIHPLASMLLRRWGAMRPYHRGKNDALCIILLHHCTVDALVQGWGTCGLLGP